MQSREPGGPVHQGDERQPCLIDVSQVRGRGAWPVECGDHDFTGVLNCRHRLSIGHNLRCRQILNSFHPVGGVEELVGLAGAAEESP